MTWKILRLGTVMAMMVMMMAMRKKPMMKTKKSSSEDLTFPSLFLVFDAKGGEEAPFI
jgi:hypothetical protein